MAHVKSVGGKHITNSHCTAIELAEKVALFLNKSGLVTKINLSIIHGKGGGVTKKVAITHLKGRLQLIVQ